jgi:hypothetical protein
MFNKFVSLNNDTKELIKMKHKIPNNINVTTKKLVSSNIQKEIHRNEKITIIILLLNVKFLRNLPKYIPTTNSNILTVGNLDIAMSRL